MNEVEEILKTADMGVADCDPQAEPEDEVEALCMLLLAADMLL